MQHGMAPIALTLYTRPGCHLCDDMKEIIGPLMGEWVCTLEEIDISQDAALDARYGLEIPVLLVNGRKAFKYRLTARELRARLRAELRAAPQS